LNASSAGIARWFPEETTAAQWWYSARFIAVTAARCTMSYSRPSCQSRRPLWRQRSPAKRSKSDLHPSRLHRRSSPRSSIGCKRKFQAECAGSTFPWLVQFPHGIASPHGRHRANARSAEPLWIKAFHLFVFGIDYASLKGMRQTEPASFS